MLLAPMEILQRHPLLGLLPHLDRPKLQPKTEAREADRVCVPQISILPVLT
jgi:hypothetical protein